jgi:PKD repeat protein
VNWSDGLTDNPRTDTNVTSNIDVTANFAVTTFTLNYAAGTGGSLTGDTSQVVNYGGDGTAVTAVPSAGYHFVDWSDGSTANPRTDTNVTANVSVTANFAIDTFTLAYAAGTGGSLTGTTAQVVNYGEDGTAVTVVPAAGYHFVDWSDGSTANSRTDTNVMADIDVTANFALDEYTLTVNQIGNGSVTPVITTTYHMGDVVELTAAADGGWAFSSWSGCTSTDGSVCSVTMDGNKIVTVTFVDTASPDTTITTFPSNPSDVASATFAFTGTDNATPSGSLTFDCKLDAGAWEVCTSPTAYSGLANGSHTFLVRAVDAAGNMDATPASYTWTVAVNQPPVADAGGPYFGYEGSSIKLSASMSTDPNNNIVSYLWDLDNDGDFDDATGKTPKFTPADNGVYTIRVRVTDSNGASDEDEATVTVRNVPPVITSLCVNSLVRVGTPVNARATFKDPGIQDTFTATWKWGDGTTSMGVVSGHVVSGSHTYNRPGIYLVTIMVKDKDGGITQTSRIVTVFPRW